MICQHSRYLHYLRHEIELAGNSRSEVVAFVAIALYFLIQEPQTETSRFCEMLMLQQLKWSRRKRVVLFQIALKNTRRARHAWEWPRNQFWFESLLQGDFVEDWWKENFRISRRTFEYIVRVVGPDLTKRDTRLPQCIHVNKLVAVVLWRLATGDTYRSTRLQFGIGRCTAMVITHDFCEAVAKQATEFIKFPATEQKVLQSIRLFTNKSPFPQVVRAIDGSHIALKTVPVNEQIEYFN